jgi:ribonuclease P protein component
MKESISIKKNNEFQRIYKKGKFIAGKYIVLYCYRNRLDIKRIGITVSKKVGNSVKRNRLKRLIRESYRYYENSILNGYDLIFVARNYDTLPGYYDIKKEIKFLLKRLKLLNEENTSCQDC